MTAHQRNICFVSLGSCYIASAFSTPMRTLIGQIEVTWMSSNQCSSAGQHLENC